MASTSLGTIGIKATLDGSQTKRAGDEIIRDLKKVEREAKRVADMQPGGKNAWPFVDPDTMRPTFKTPTFMEPNSAAVTRQPFGGKTGFGSQKGSGTGMANLAGMNVAFGLDDFIQQTQAQGVAAGLRAIGNNATAVAAAFGPIPVIATAAGVALLSVGIKALDAGDPLEQYKGYLKGVEEALQSVRQNAEMGIRVGNIETQEDADKRVKDLREQIAAVNEEEKFAQQRFNAAEQGQKQERQQQRGEMSFFTNMMDAAIGSLSSFIMGTQGENRPLADFLAPGNPVDLAEQETTAGRLNQLAKERAKLESEIAEIQRTEAKRLKEQEDANRKAVEKRREADRGAMLKREMEDFHKQIEEQEKEAESLRRQHETSAERRKREIADINRLEEVGALSAQEAQRFREKVNGQDNKLALSGFVSSTSAEAISIINRAAIGVPASDKNEQKQIVSNTNETADNTKQAVALLAKIAQDLGGINAEVA